MRFAPVALACLLMMGCTGEDAQSPPFGPSDTWPSGSPALVTGMVVDSSGVCIPGATVEVLSGRSTGVTVTQVTPCDAWSYWGGFQIAGLDPGVTLLARAPGYVSATKITGPGWESTFVLTGN